MTTSARSMVLSRILTTLTASLKMSKTELSAIHCSEEGGKKRVFSQMLLSFTRHMIMASVICL
uniref:Uncharacterized protein n=1 Tax=Anguilla anguilla TaxID=7936 RepID=A0A0E9S3N0_ANGAN